MLIGAKLADNLRKAEKIPELMRDKVQEETDKETGEVRKISLADKIAEGVKRDLEKLEEKRAAKENKGRGQD